jgi:hypothetical protein
MSFVPGALELYQDGPTYILSIKGEKVFHTRSAKAALAKFKEIRLSLENHFPSAQITFEEKRALMRKVLSDAAVDATLRRPPKKRSTARSSRTFGG